MLEVRHIAHLPCLIDTLTQLSLCVKVLRVLWARLPQYWYFVRGDSLTWTPHLDGRELGFGTGYRFALTPVIGLECCGIVLTPVLNIIKTLEDV